ncbi:sugar ABC transporter permease [Chloroflexi bacterium TSY]|nr:sugar ABC transporter permease [Chloroflexi bacterium TSY]
MSTTVVETKPGRQKLRPQARREELEFYLSITPWLLGFVIFIAGPFLASLYLGFTNYNGFHFPELIGLENFQKLVQDELFWTSLRVTVTYAILSVPLQIIVGLSVAVLLNQRVRGLSIWRTVYFTPAVVSGVAVAMLWMWMFNPEFGLINMGLRFIGIAGPQWIFSRTWALPSLVIMSLWGVGSTMVIYLAGLQSIPTEFYEAASIDGAGAVRKFISITLPLLSPVIFFMLVIGIINSFQVFTEAYIMTGGGPGNATLFYVLYLYQKGFQQFSMGYASALAWVLFVIILILTLFIFKSSRFWVYYETDLGTRE